MKKIEFKPEDMLDLNMNNIDWLKKECCATSPENQHMYCFASSATPGYGNLNLPCDKNKLEEHKEKIRFMLGQLLAVHTQTPLISLEDACQKFNGVGLNGEPTGTPWISIKNPTNLMFLFTFAHGCHLIPQFSYRALQNSTKLVCSIFDLGEIVPTTPPTQIKSRPEGREPSI